MSTRVNLIRVLTVIALVTSTLGFVAARSLPNLRLVPAVEASGAANEPLPPETAPLENNSGGTPAQAAASPELAPAGGANGFYRTVSGTCFTPHGTNNAVSAYDGGGGIYRVSGSIEFDCLLDLPQGARVTEIVWYLVDNSASDINLWFATYQPSAPAYANIASTTTSGAHTNALITRVMSGNPLTTIDNSKYQYLLEVGLNDASSFQAIYGARIVYTLAATYAPLVSQGK